ncbi:MAG: flagellar biosynthesis protein FlhF [Candidatus Hydrogenedentes bacterium]|nr:flagellar biosynthesis protein FlhF [Candidatus Hydrogenedentota bacterium]
MAQKLHKFQAPSLDEAYLKMREQLGDDAVVVRTSQVRQPGLFGLIGARAIELIAAAPDLPPPPPRLAERASRAYQAASRDRLATPSLDERTRPVEPARPADDQFNKTVAHFQRLLSSARARHNSPGGYSGASAGNTAIDPAYATGAEDEPLRREVNEMRKMLEVFVAEHGQAAFSTAFRWHHERLVALGLPSRQAKDLLNAVDAATSDSETLTKRLHGEICRRINTTGGLTTRPGVCQVIALVGPTGVGKTTNLAKLAARFAIEERARTALITADTYRIAAPEQLEKYANIMGVPLAVVNNAPEMASAIYAHRHCDLIFIDTMGSSQYNASQIEELRAIMIAADAEEVALTLAANTPAADLRQAIENFACLKPTSVLFTKVDETRQYGAMLSLLLDTTLPLCYLSVGQDVPNDIALARPQLVADIILEVLLNRGGSS